MAKILIAEDDPATRYILAKTVEKMGHIAIFSPNGRHAWETLQVNPDIRLLITDVMMPEMDGRQLIGVIRGNEDFRDLPVIIISAVIGPKAIHDLLQIGATFFLPKPLDYKEVIHYVARYLEPETENKNAENG